MMSKRERFFVYFSLFFLLVLIFTPRNYIAMIRGYLAKFNLSIWIKSIQYLESFITKITKLNHFLLWQEGNGDRHKFGIEADTPKEK